MDKLQVVQFDVRGTRVENRVIREKIPIKYKDCPWIVPNGSPYFAENALVSIYNEAGGKLVLGTDYWFEGKFIPFCEVTGRNISSFVKLSDKILAENDFVSMTYQSIGAWFVPRNSIDEWVDQIYKGKIPIPWSKVFNVPPTLPSSLHKHSIKTEIGDWYELTFFFNYLANYYSTRDPAVYTDADRIINDCFNQLKTVKAAQMARLRNHDKDYANSHRITKFHLDLGNLDNFGTATPAQDVAGVADNLFSTPAGLLELSEDYTPNTDAAMRAGVLPISYFGGGSYIPPQITGSYEGLGSLSVCSAMCLERNGTFMLVTGHHDGRNEGLYYSQLPNFAAGLNAGRLTYTGYKYQPPSLSARGFNPTTVIPGSNHRVMMVGDVDLDRWFVTLTNGTLDANAHQYTEVNMAPVLVKGKAVLASYANNDNRMAIHYIADYIVLIISPGTGQLDIQLLFRIPASKFKEGHAILEWEQIMCTYKDYDNVQYTNVDRFQPLRQTVANGEIRKFGPVSFLQPALASNRAGKTMTLSCRKPNSANTGYLFILQGNNASYRTATETRTVSCIIGTGYELNPATGVFTELFRTPDWTADFEGTTLAQRDAYTRQHYYQFYDGYGQAAGVSSIILESGEVVMATSTSGNNFPTYLYRVKYKNRANAADVMTKRMDIAFSPLEYERRISQLVGSPLLHGVFGGNMSYEPDGELFSATDPATNNRKTYFRKVTGPYAARPQVTNIEVSGVLSRPLTNEVYQTNMEYYETPIAVTGSAAELTARGAECGSTAFSSMGYSSMGSNHYYPKLAEFKAPAADNMLISCARTYSKVLDTPLKRATYKADTFIGTRQNVIDKFKALIPSEYSAYVNSSPWSVCIHLLRDESGGMFKGLDIGIAIVAFHDIGMQFSRQMLVLFRPSVEAPNTSHPGSYLLKDFTVLDVSESVRAGFNVRVPEQNLLGLINSRAKGGLHVYRDGNKLLCYSMNPYSTNTTSTIYSRQIAKFDVDISTNKFENYYGYMASWSIPEFCVPIPKVGMSDVNVSGTTINNRVITIATPGVNDYTGGAARLLHKTNPDDGTVQWFIGPTVYPETIWSLFFQDGIPMMICGSIYEMPGGTIDLRDIDPAPANKTFYVYATIEDSKPRYILSTVALRRGNALLLVATVTTGPTQILTIERYQPFVIGDHEMSYTRKGGIIPVSSGMPQDDGTFRFLKASELLP